MDVEDERQSNESATELDITRLDESTTQCEVDACSHNTAAFEAIFDSCSEDFNETKNERTILATITGEDSQVDSQEPKKKRVKFCNLDCKNFCADGGAFEKRPVYEGNAGEYYAMQGAAPQAQEGVRVRSKDVIDSDICGGRCEKNSGERQKISYIPRFGKGSRLYKSGGEEKEKHKRKENVSEISEEFVLNDLKLKKISIKDELSSASPHKRPRTLCADETRPSKHVRRHSGPNPAVRNDSMDLEVCPLSQKGLGTGSPSIISSSVEITTPTVQSAKVTGSELSLEPKPLHSLGKCKKTKHGQVKVEPYLTEASAFLRKQNKLRIEQKKMLSAYTNAVYGKTKSTEIFDYTNIVANQFRIPQQTEARLARPGHKLSYGKSFDKCNDAQEAENKIMALAALKIEEGKSEAQKRRIAEEKYANCAPGMERLATHKMEATCLEIRHSSKQNFTSDCNVAENARTEKCESCLTELCGEADSFEHESDISVLNGAMREKKPEVRKPLNRSCSNPGPGRRKPQAQERQQTAAQTSEAAKSDMMSNRNEVERLREEVHNHKRVIRQLSLRIPLESYKENQPLSLGHIPSTSVDNVFEALLRPSRPRQEASEVELQELVSELRAENTNLRTELQETRDQADLLEFRVLELTEGSDRFSEGEKATVSRDSEEKADAPQAFNFEDLSLPLSIDSGLDLTADGRRARCGATEQAALAKPGDLHTSAVQPLSAAAPQTTALPAGTSDTAPPLEVERKPSDTAGFDANEQEATGAPAELPDVVSNFQHYLHRPHLLHASLLATVEKLRNLDSSVSDLEAKVSTVTRENHYLTETLSSLNEAQETRTEASGTESEIVSRKTPSLHSDLSDSDSDSAPPDTTLAKKRFEALSNFQESGIFEGSADVNHAASQTEDDGQAVAHTQEKERLELQNARLHQDLQELRQNYDQLLQNDKCPRCVQWAEVDRGESRALKEQLRVAQGARKALYEEKCELEEAENDARLMVQRLDSQLTAAREMELLLSASLSQEQEISRELHKKVKELQYLQAAEKERSYRQGLLEKENMDEGAVNLVLDKDTYASQLEFVKYSLILLHVFRHFHLLNTWMSGVGSCQVPTEGLELVDECVRENKVIEASDDNDFKQRRNHIDETLIKLSDDPIGSSQPTLQSTVDTELNFPSTFLSLDEMIDDHPKFPEFLMPGCTDVGVQTEPFDLGAGVSAALESSGSLFSSAPDQHLSAVPARKVEVQTKSTMTVEKDLLSVRESFYLEQIEALQEEKSVLRKEFGQQRSVSVEREGLLQNTIQELQAQLVDCERAREALQCEMELQKDKEETLSKDFHKYMEQSRNDQARSSELHEIEKIALRRDFDARLTEVIADRRRHSDRCDELQHQLSALWRELEGADAAGYEGAPHSAASPSRDANDSSPCPPTDTGRLDGSNVLDAVRRILKSESSLRARVTELEKKESAYRETIQEADQIMLSHVTSYKQRIDELEAVHEQREARVRQLECSEERLRSSLKSNARCDQDVRVAELLEQLLTTEKSELDLKHKLWSLEKSEKELKIKVIEGEKSQEGLRAELRDQDDLVRKMHSLQSENCALTHQLQRAHESVRRAVDKQQTESLLKGRVEELEYAENALKTSMQQAYAAHALKERRLNQQVTALEEEIASLKKRVEAAGVKEAQILESELSLKRHVEALRTELQDAKRELKMSSADESSSRTEVSRLRSQLKQANGELTDAESINCSLRERLAASEQLKETLERSLEERKRRHESDLLQLNLQVSQQESRLEETEAQLCSLTQMHAAQELDLLAASPLEPVMRAARGLTAQLSLCEACSRSQGRAIEDLTLQMDTLSDLLSGAQQQDDSDGEEYGDATQRSSVTTVRTRTDSAPSTSASEVRPDDSVRHSSEGCSSNCMSDVSATSEGSKYERAEESHRTVSPAPVPAPRRKRKLKRELVPSLRSSLKLRKKGGSTILEELEEKVRELEESISTKDEELKLADSEATDMSTKLAAAEQIAVTKEAEADTIRQAFSELQLQLAASLQNNEATERNLELKHKEAEDTWKQEVARLALQLTELRSRGRLKDSLITALVMHIRAFLRPCKVEAIIEHINGSQEETEDGSKRAEQECTQFPGTDISDAVNRAATDHDVQTVCALLSLPYQVTARSEDSRAPEAETMMLTEDAAVQTDEVSSAPLMVHRQTQATLEACVPELSSMPVNSCTLMNKSVSLSNTEEYNITNSSRNNDGSTASSASSEAGGNCSLPLGNVVEKVTFAENTLSSVHQSTQTPPLYSSKIGPHQKSFIPKIVKPQSAQANRGVHRAISFNSKLSSLARQVSAAPSRGPVKMSGSSSSSSALAGPKLNGNLTETGVGCRRAAGVPVIESTLGGDPINTPTPGLRTTTRASSQVEEKDLNKASSSIQSSDELHSQTCKKLRVNLASQERSKSSWQAVRRFSRNISTALGAGCEAKSSNAIPRPSDLKITRWVGKDGVVIAWELQNHDGVVGFQVIVAGKVVQSIKSSKRTKALITGVSSTSSVSIGLVSVSADGRCSKPAVVICDRSKTSLTMH